MACGLLLIAQSSQAADRPDGFAKDVTGGGDVVATHPTTLDELRKALCSSYDQHGHCSDDTPRVIQLDHSFDFRGSVLINGRATTTEEGCVVNPCPAGGEQLAINGFNGFCYKRKLTSVTYDNAGLTRLNVGSNKTLMGVGSEAGIRGIALHIGGGVHNVIVRNLTLSDINPQVVWAGDALIIENADGVWISNNTFARVGRQMISTGWMSTSHVTISDNEFDGRTPYSSSCDGHHYWVWLFLGNPDTLTVARNYVHDTSGRGPHAGGLGNADVTVQLVNNVYSQVSYQGAIMPRTPYSHLLVEGNDFEYVTHPFFYDAEQPGKAFALFAPGTDAQNSACQNAIGRPCVPNQQHFSGDDYRPEDVEALQAFSQHLDYLITPMSADTALTQVPQTAGAGKIDAATLQAKSGTGTAAPQ
ncbi:pectate lyase [Pseudomonas floridensis]|uniref:pectin lyase n=1 Tax=Pseudomonas floridensis TaxID=1958950 RepID=A0A1X0N5Y5_9PSED|nr:pectate lyase [Pseudomonas floridensis]ORC58335.1 pectate lyase [Pseudomonas floridensis]